MTDVGYIGQETMAPDGYLQPRRFKITAHCNRCDSDFHWITTKLSGKDRPCPKAACKRAVHAEMVEREARNMAQIILDQRPPAHIGDKPVVKAIDTTADIVMTDYAMTDLKDNIRIGESMAPKLPPAQQRAADNFFGGQKNAQGQLLNRLGQAAIAGGARASAITPADMHPMSKKGESPLRLVRTEWPMGKPPGR